MTDFQHLNKRDDLRTLLYHLKEITETPVRIQQLLTRLDMAIGVDEEKVQAILGELETELFWHLPFHLAKLRDPFELLLKEYYGKEARIVVDQDD